MLQGGVPHQVLNARKHDEESQIIARAGAFGAVTIATNMAGRGVDIKLGGELPEEIIARCQPCACRNPGCDDPYDMTMEVRAKPLRQVEPRKITASMKPVSSVFLHYMDDMERVRELGGLHVIGSERHEARRIDNQLRGRAARQGDPGSSRFYLSLEDELMRLFGGGQVEDLMGTPATSMRRCRSRAAWSAGWWSSRRTGWKAANFDIRKHLLEYDDVLNSQREKIYGQRDRVFTKDDLSEDVTEIFRDELTKAHPRGFEG